MFTLLGRHTVLFSCTPAVWQLRLNEYVTLCYGHASRHSDLLPIPIGCIHSEVGRIVRELQFVRCEHSLWLACVQNPNSVPAQFSSYDENDVGTTFDDKRWRSHAGRCTCRRADVHCRATYTVRPTCDRDIRLRQTYQPLGQSSRLITLYYTCHSVETSAVFNGRHRSRPFGRMGTFIAQLDTEEMSEIKYSAIRIRTSHGHSQNVNHSSNFISARSILSTITDALISCCWRNAFNR